MTLNLDAGGLPHHPRLCGHHQQRGRRRRHRGHLQRRFHQRRHHAPTGENLVWSPTNSRSSLSRSSMEPPKSLLISQEEFADTGIQTALEAALKRGVAVTLVQENMEASIPQSQHAQERRGQDRHLQLPDGLLHSRQNGPGRLRHGAGKLVRRLRELLHRFARQKPRTWPDLQRPCLHGGH